MTPDLRVLVDSLDGAGIPALVIEGDAVATPSERETARPRPRGRIELLVPKPTFRGALRRFDDLGWRYA